jgi:CelD/BcsL family acetyltransferase involved in cellulose biosynthesis
MRDQAAWSGAILPGAICPYVARPASWESFLSAHSGRFRRKIRWELKRARARGELGFEVTTDLDGDHTLDRLGSLHERRPVGPATSSLLASRRDRAFLREGLRWLSELGALRIPLLRLEGRIISFCVGFVSGRRFYYYLPSFDPDFAALAPGRLLLALLVQAMAELQVDEIDLMKGDEPYKLEWATTYRRGLRVLMHNPRSISRVAYSAVAAFAQFRGRARTVPLARYLRFRLWPLLQQVLRRGVRLG